ncbi:MAG: DUF1475 family protein [Deltaproteobacteria bacterium]|nr:DUF1475 family protein [Deltaproteobacteria bacterium]
MALTVIMFVAIAIATATGDFGEEGSLLLDAPWGRMTLIDLYVGVALIFGWVILRERKLWVALLWLPVFVVLGHGGTALYAALAAFRSDDVEQFLLGWRAQRKASG